MGKITSIYIQEDLRKEIDKICEESGRSLADVVREALRDFVEKYKEKKALDKIANEMKTNDIKKVLKKMLEEIVKNQEDRTNHI